MSSRPPGGGHGPSSIGDPGQQSLSLREVHDDDALLDRLGARDGDAADGANGAAVGAAGAAEPAAGLLAALARDVDRDLPTGVDELAVRALAAALAQHAAEQEEPGATVTLLPANRPTADTRQVRVLRPSRILGARRGMSMAVAASVLVASASVAAAVSQDPVGAFGVRAISRLVTGEPDEVSKSDLTRQLQVLAQQPTGPDPAVLAELRQQASRLPDFGGPQVQQQLASLAARVTVTATVPAATGSAATGSAATGSAGATAASSPSSTAPTTTTPPARPTSSALSPPPPKPVVVKPARSATDPTRTPAAPTSPLTPKPSAQPTTPPISQTPTAPTGSPTGTATSSPSAPPTMTSTTAPTSNPTTTPTITTNPTTAPPTNSAPQASPSNLRTDQTMAPSGLPTRADVLAPATATPHPTHGATGVGATGVGATARPSAKTTQPRR